MGLSIQQLSDESKLSQALRFEVLEQLCPPELVSELLPPRRLRFYPRVVKRAYSSFHRKRPGRQGFTLKKQSFRDILLILFHKRYVMLQWEYENTDTKVAHQ